MLMGIAWVHYAYARYACVMGLRWNDGKRGRKLGGVFGMSTLAIKDGVNQKRARKKFQKFLLFLVDTTSP